MIDKELLNILACPSCKGDVNEQGAKIVCQACGRKYPIVDGIPVMLIEESEPEEKNSRKGKVSP